MQISSRRRFFGRMASLTAALVGGTKLASAQAAAPQTPPAPAVPSGRGGRHTYNGIFYFSGTGSNDGYGREDHILVTDPFEKHVTRAMDALKKSLERAGSKALAGWGQAKQKLPNA